MTKGQAKEIFEEIGEGHRMQFYKRQLTEEEWKIYKLDYSVTVKYQCAAKKNKTVDVQQYTILKHLCFHKMISDNVCVYLCVTKI